MINNMHKNWIAFYHHKKGSTAIEYGLIAALIALAIIAGLTMVGSDMSNNMNDISNNF